ncbi:U7-hexatoxin-Hi1a-like [Ptychodera flava]|uniref:U7-hexatoxin-Hi1a-like n=1 Tax=Ptychodera flava TaxID=63121 RepID=UPI00396A717C
MYRLSYCIGLCLVFFLFLSSSAANLLGAPGDVDVNDKGVIEAAEFAVTELNKMSNSLYLNKLTDIIKAQRQLVHGYNYFLTIEITPTTCRNNRQNLEKLESCPIDTSKNAEPSICEVGVNVVEDRPGDKVMQFVRGPPVCTRVSKLNGNL